jgi:2Fe-2S ferredoxin
MALITIEFFEHSDPAAGIHVQAETGKTLMRAGVAAGLEGIAADCGGTLTCATCHVRVREPWLSRLPPLTPDEDSMLDYAASARSAGSRLACQIRLEDALDGMQVDLPPTQY